MVNSISHLLIHHTHVLCQNCFTSSDFCDHLLGMLAAFTLQRAPKKRGQHTFLLLFLKRLNQI